MRPYFCKDAFLFGYLQGLGIICGKSDGDLKISVAATELIDKLLILAVLAHHNLILQLEKTSHIGGLYADKSTALRVLAEQVVEGILV